MTCQHNYMQSPTDSSRRFCCICGEQEGESEMKEDITPRAYRDMIRVPAGGGAVHFIPNLWDSDDHNNLGRRLTIEQTGHRIASTLIDSFDYLLSDAITQKEAIRRLKLMREARKNHAGLVD